MPKCDVDMIKAFSVHDYKCKESYWRDNYGHMTGKYYTGLIEQLGDHGGKDWKKYLAEMEIWVTETNCSGDDD